MRRFKESAAKLLPKNMNRNKWIVALVLVALVALFVPFVPQTQASGHFLGASYRQSAVVSPPYYAFHCGSYVDSQFATQLSSGYSGILQLSQGYNFACNYSSQ